MKSSHFLIKTREVCPQTSYYNKNESTSYKYENKTSQDTFYFYNDIETSSLKKYDEISFGYAEFGNIKTICADMGLNMVNSFEKQNENIVYSLKSRKYIDNYYVSFKFDEKKAFDNYENLKGKIIIGEPPHEYDKNDFYREQYKGGTAYIISVNDYVLLFDKVYLGLKNNPKTILINSDNNNKFKVSFEISYGLISAPDVYLDYIESNFFNKSEIANICKKSKEKGKIFDYDAFICENDIKTKFNLFPEISLFYQNFNYNFTFNYEDLFMLRNNKYYFKIIFLGGGYSQWRFGLPFFLKYRLVLNQDKKQIGFYDDNIKVSKDINDNNNSIIKSVWFWIIIFILLVVIIIITIVISKKIFGKKRKHKVNELNDEYDYEEHKGDTNFNDTNNKNSLFKNE
jgi:hypothetical protein